MELFGDIVFRMTLFAVSALTGSVIYLWIEHFILGYKKISFETWSMTLFWFFATLAFALVNFT